MLMKSMKELCTHGMSVFGVKNFMEKLCLQFEASRVDSARDNFSFTAASQKF